MIQRVVVTPKARIELYNAAIWWAENRDADQATRWLEGIEAAIDALRQNPEQYPAARENDDLPVQLRQQTFGLGKKPTHRIVFEIRVDELIVHAVRHLARDDLTREDLG